MSEPDVPSPIDLRNPEDAREWERTAQARPGRAEIFRTFASELQGIGQGNLKVLELGSGPGFLAEFLLDELPTRTLELTLLDFSPAMHDLTRIRLGERADHVRFLERSFKDLDWNHDLGPFDAVITHQSVHELRHKRYATALHIQVRRALKPNAPYLVSDHYCGEGGMTNDRLFMTVDEQRESLEAAGFTAIDRVMQAGSLVMHRAA